MSFFLTFADYRENRLGKVTANMRFDDRVEAILCVNDLKTRKLGQRFMLFDEKEKRFILEDHAVQASPFPDLTIPSATIASIAQRHRVDSSFVRNVLRVALG